MPMDPDRRRINRELKTLRDDPPDFCRFGASPVTDLLHWEVVIDGPAGSPYAGGTFPVDIDFIGDYPRTPPKITFKTKVYHPNISSEGELMLDIFHQKNWSMAMSVDKLLLYVVSVLYDPVLDCDPINEDVADIYVADLDVYEGTAMAWTWEYSSTPIVSHLCPIQLTSAAWGFIPGSKPPLLQEDTSWSISRRPRYPKDVAASSRRSAYKEKRIGSRDDASSPAHETRIVVPRETWKSVVAFLRGCTVALPFPTFRRRFSSTLLPLSHYSGRACFAN